MHPAIESQLLSTRRQLLSSAGTGVGLAALSGLLQADGLAADGADATALGGLPDDD